MSKWWNTKRQSTLSEYDKTPDKKEWLSITWSDVGRVFVSSAVYWSILSLLPSDWGLYKFIPASIGYVIIYMSLLFGGMIYTDCKHV